VRVDVPVLERELFRLFESKPAWTFQQLQLETKQPTTHLKVVVEQVRAQRILLCVNFLKPHPVAYRFVMP